MSVSLLRRHFTVEEYHRMAEAGIFSEDDRMELIQGEIVMMTPIGARHASCVTRLTHFLVSRLGDRAAVWVQNPVRIGPDSEVQPDLALLRARSDFYHYAHPGPEDVLLIIEVADTSVESDRAVKVPSYARAGIPAVWLIDLPGGSVEVHMGPASEGYRDVRRFERGHSIPLNAFPEITLSVETILG